MIQWLTDNYYSIFLVLAGGLGGAAAVWVHCFRWVNCYKVIWENERNGNASARKRLTALEEERMGFKEKVNEKK